MTMAKSAVACAQKEPPMTTELEWETSLESAQQRAAAERRFILADFSRYH